MNKRIAVAIAAAAAVAGCGGSSWVDPTTGNFSATDSADVLNMISNAFGAAVQIGKSPGGLNALTQSVSVTQSCAVSGTVSVTGEMNSNCSSSSACTFNGGLDLDLASCTDANGVTGNGGLYIGASGSADSSANTMSLHETIQGGITVSRNGVTIGTCGINVTVDIASTSTSETVHVSGTVCRQVVAQ
jgi:hypothetical protein